MKIKLIKDLGYIYPTKNSKQKRRYGMYLCECGSEFKANTYNIESGRQKNRCQSCAIKSKTKHGMSKTKLFNTYTNMIVRCTKTNNPQYCDYGARGINVCPEWLNDSSSFFTWAKQSGYREGLELDRINNNIGYSPENCRWTTREIQTQNTRRIQKNNTSGYRGVWMQSNGKYSAEIRNNKKRIWLGTFSTAYEASLAYDNFIEENNLEHTKNNS